MSDIRATIKVRKETRERIGKIGVRGQSYDDILNQLADLWDNRPKTAAGRGE